MKVYKKYEDTSTGNTGNLAIFTFIVAFIPCMCIQGDSGGPFVCQRGEGGPWFQYGCTSFGRNPCGGENEPTVFCRISYFRDWIITTSNGKLLSTATQEVFLELH